MRIEPTWEDRDLPVLRAIVDIFEETQDAVMQPRIAEVTAFSAEDVRKAMSALSTAEPSFFEVHQAGGQTGIFAMNPTERARRAVGLWPTPEDLADRLIANFDRAARGADADKRPALRAIVEFLRTGGRELAVQVAAESLNRATGWK